jgi:hypothetical protein
MGPFTKRKISWYAMSSGWKGTPIPSLLCLITAQLGMLHLITYRLYPILFNPPPGGWVGLSVRINRTIITESDLRRTEFDPDLGRLFYLDLPTQQKVSTSSGSSCTPDSLRSSFTSKYCTKQFLRPYMFRLRIIAIIREPILRHKQRIVRR